MESSYQTSVFREVQEARGIPLFGLRDEDSRALSPSEYVGMICDTLKLQKNVGLCRHFHMLDKASIASSRGLRYIDVWPVNMFYPSEGDPFDESSLFMLQLACIINMVSYICVTKLIYLLITIFTQTPSWKKLRLRVMLCVSHPASSSSISLSGDYLCGGILFTIFPYEPVTILLL